MYKISLQTLSEPKTNVQEVPVPGSQDYGHTIGKIEFSMAKVNWPRKWFEDMSFLQEPNQSCNDSWRRTFPAAGTQSLRSHFVLQSFILVFASISGRCSNSPWSNLSPGLLPLWSVHISITDFSHYLSASALCWVWQASSKPHHTSLCNITSITSLCVSKLALNRAELSIRWSKSGLLTLGSLTQEMVWFVTLSGSQGWQTHVIYELKVYQHHAGSTISVALTLFMALAKSKDCETRSLAGYK